jgi:hypothetical protein
MMEWKSIDLIEAIEKSPAIYKLSLEYIYSILLPNETVIFVGKATHHEKYDMGSTNPITYVYKEDIRCRNTPSLVIITNKRWIRKWTSWSLGDLDNPILFSDKISKQNFINTWKEHYRWSEPLNEMPSEKNFERKGITTQEWAESNIKFVSLENIYVENKYYCFSNKNGIKKKYMRLVVNDTDYTFEPEDGNSVFSLIQLAASNNGNIILNDGKKFDITGNDDDVLSKLERLAILKKQGFITDEEFSAQKKKLLN